MVLLVPLVLRDRPPLVDHGVALTFVSAELLAAHRALDDDGDLARRDRRVEPRRQHRREQQQQHAS